MLTRASWDSNRYVGYRQQPLVLQFRPAASGTYRPVRTVSTSRHGRASTAVTATVDGCFRYVFAGTSTTTGATSVGDCVDVR